MDEYIIKSKTHPTEECYAFIIEAAERTIPAHVVMAQDQDEALMLYTERFPDAEITDIEVISRRYKGSEAMTMATFSAVGSNVRKYEHDNPVLPDDPELEMKNADIRGFLDQQGLGDQTFVATVKAMVDDQRGGIGCPLVERAIDLPDLLMWMLKEWKEPGRLLTAGRILSLSTSLVRTQRPYGHEGQIIQGGDVPPDLEPEDGMDGTFDSNALAAARLFYVTSDISKLINRRCRDLPATTLTTDLMPHPTGLVFFADDMTTDYPVVLDRVGEVNQPIRAILWGPHRGGIRISTYEMDEGYGLFPVGHTDWWWGSDTTELTFETKGSPELDELRRDAMNEDRRRLATFWLIVSQPGLVDVVISHPARGVRRRAERARLEFDPAVRVIDVHAPKYVPSTQATERQVEWTRRWIVHEHWRQQACGPNRSERKPVLIGEHIKGPTDKPLIEKETVYLLRDEGRKQP